MKAAEVASQAAFDALPLLRCAPRRRILRVGAGMGSSHLPFGGPITSSRLSRNSSRCEDFFNLVDEMCGGEGLLEKGVAVGECFRRLRRTGNQKHPELWPLSFQVLCQLRSGHSSAQCNIGEEQIEWAVPPRQRTDRVGRGTRGYDSVAGTLKDFGDKLPQGQFVFDNENYLGLRHVTTYPYSCSFLAKRVFVGSGRFSELGIRPDVERYCSFCKSEQNIRYVLPLSSQNCLEGHISVKPLLDGRNPAFGEQNKKTHRRCARLFSAVGLPSQKTGDDEQQNRNTKDQAEADQQIVFAGFGRIWILG